jgi:hypothetical protein
LTASYHAYDERAEPEAVVDVQREHGHRDADNEEGDKDRGHDR